MEERCCTDESSMEALFTTQDRVSRCLAYLRLLLFPRRFASHASSIQFPSCSELSVFVTHIAVYIYSMLVPCCALDISPIQTGLVLHGKVTEFKCLPENLRDFGPT